MSSESNSQVLLLQRWMECTTDRQKDDFLKPLAPFLLDQETNGFSRRSLRRHVDSLRSLGVQLPEHGLGKLASTGALNWKEVFESYGLEAAYYNYSDVYHEKHSNSAAEVWLRSQLLPSSVAKDGGCTILSPLMNLLLFCVSDAYNSSPFLPTLPETIRRPLQRFELMGAISDLVARTLSLVARGDNELPLYQLGWVSTKRIFDFFGLDDKTREELRRWCSSEGGGERFPSLRPFLDASTGARFDPAGSRLRAACAYCILHGSTEWARSLPAPSPRGTSWLDMILVQVQVSVEELQCYVPLAHAYLSSMSPESTSSGSGSRGSSSRGSSSRGNSRRVGGNGGSGGSVGDYKDHRMLERSNLALNEALGPRGDERPEDYFATSQTDPSHVNCLLTAVQDGNCSRVRMLLSQPYGVDCNDKVPRHRLMPFGEHDNDKNSCLIWACRNGVLEIVDLLLAAGATIDHASPIVGSALNWCAGYGRYKALQRMLRAGADVDIVDERGQTAASLAGPPARFEQLSLGEPANGVATAGLLRDTNVARKKSAATKKKGNNAFVRGDYETAIGLYTTAMIELGHESPKLKSILYSNRSQCFINLGQFANAKGDAANALAKDDTNRKAQLRLEKAEEELLNGKS